MAFCDEVRHSHQDQKSVAIARSQRSDRSRGMVLALTFIEALAGVYGSNHSRRDGRAQNGVKLAAGTYLMRFRAASLVSDQGFETVRKLILAQ